MRFDGGATSRVGARGGRHRRFLRALVVGLIAVVTLATSLPAVSAQVRPNQPAQPSASYDAGSGSVVVRWSAPPVNEAGSIVGYNIDRNGEYYSTVGGATEFRDDSVTPGQTYRYRISAFAGPPDQRTYSETSDETSIAVPDAPGGDSEPGDPPPPDTNGDGPQVPTNLAARAVRGDTASVNPDGIKVSWNAGGGPTSIGFNINRDGEFLESVADPFFVDCDVVAGRTYSYTVSAWSEGPEFSPTTTAVEATANVTPSECRSLRPPGPGGPDGPVEDPIFDVTRNINAKPATPQNVRINGDRLQWDMPRSARMLFQITRNGLREAEGDLWAQLTVTSGNPNLQYGELSDGRVRFSVPVDRFSPGDRFTIQAIHPYEITEVPDNARFSASSRFATITNPGGGRTIGNFLSTFGTGARPPGPWIGDRDDWKPSPQFSDQFDGSGKLADRPNPRWYFARNDGTRELTPAYTRDQKQTDRRAVLRDGKLEMSANIADGTYSYIGTANDSGDGYLIDPTNGVFVEASVRLDRMTPADNAWWSFWLMASGGDNCDAAGNPIPGATNPYDGHARTGTEIDIFEFVPDLGNGFNQALFRYEGKSGHANCRKPDQSKLAPYGRNFTYEGHEPIPGVDMPRYTDGDYHRLGMYYAQDCYAFYLDDELIWQVNENDHPGWITPTEREAIRMTWEIQNPRTTPGGDRITNPWTSRGGNFANTALDGNPTVYIDFVNVWEKKEEANGLCNGGPDPEPQPDPEPEPVLEAPVDVNAAADGGTVRLSWAAGEGLEPAGYDITRNGAGYWTVTDTSFVDEQVDEGVDYTYKVVPWTEGDDGERTYGPHSDEVTVTAGAGTGTDPDPDGDPDDPDDPDPDGDDDGDTGVDIDPSGADGTLAIESLRELRDADLPAWAKEDALADLGYLDQDRGGSNPGEPFDWSSLSDEELDRPFETAYGFDLDKVAETEAALANPSDLQTRGLCGGRWKNKKKTIEERLVRGSDTLGLSGDKDLGNGFSAEFSSEADLDGTLEFKAVVHYRERSNRCIGIPYRWDFTYADIDFIATTDGALEVDNTITLRNKVRLWEKELELLRTEARASIAEVLTFRAVLTLELLLALDLETALTFTQTTKVNQDYNLDGRYESYLRCDADGCDERESGVSEFAFTTVDRPQTYTQRTLDIVLTPSADLHLNLDVHAGVLYLIEDRIFRGTVGVIAEMPVRLYWTEGNACSDADGDGLNEEVSALILDVNAQLRAYAQARIGGSTLKQWIKLNVPNGWVRGRLYEATRPGVEVPILKRNLTMRVLRRGDHTPLEPVVTKAGLFSIGARNFEGVNVGGVRDCYPFEELPTVEVNWGDGSITTHRLQPGGGPIAHNWADDGRNRLVRVRVKDDSIGRRINGPWIDVQIDENSNLAPPEIAVPVLRVGSGDSGPELQWSAVEHAVGYNVYRDGAYVDTLRGVTSWSLAGFLDQQHRYHVVAFDDENDIYTDASNTVVYGGSGTVGSQGRPRAIVSMGDSFISGEGGRWAGNAKTASLNGAGTDRGRDSYVGASRGNGCHRSDVAEIDSAGIPDVIPLNIACSGARGEHVRSTSFKGEAPQTQQLAALAADHDIEMIVLSIGGNDLGFGEILSDCISRYVRGRSPCLDDGIYTDILNEAVPEVTATVEAIQQTMEAVGDDDYRLVLQSYVSPIPREDQIRYRSGNIHILDSRTENGCAFYGKDLDWARDTVVPLLDSEYRKIAAAAGIEFLSLRDAFSGKEVCAKGTRRATSSNLVSDPGVEDVLEWVRWGNVNAGVQGDIEELLHPNALGQQALGRCLALTWERPGSTSHRCERAGSRPEDMRVIDSVR